MAIVGLHEVCKSFDGAKAPAVAPLSVELKTGLVTGLVGPDGAGKTTLLRMIAGLLHTSSGEIRVNGLDPVRDAAILSGQGFIGYMPQKFGLYEDLTVQENLNLYGDLRAVIGQERKTTFARLLEFTDLARFTKRPAGKLSGGMKQKLGVACALLGRPKLLLLDEPGVGVDPISRRELWKMVQALVSEGMAVVWSTAYLDEAELCQEVLLLNEGKLLFAGRPTDLNSRVKGRCFELRDLTGNKRAILSRALQHPAVGDGTIQARSLRLVLRDGAQLPAAKELDAGEHAHFAQVDPRFEDAFIDILGGGPGGVSVLAERMRTIPLDGAPVIVAHELTKRFGDFVAANRIELSVRRGEIFGLLGPNGAGKSTTFKMICGLLRPTGGSASILGLDLTRSGGRARQQVGYMAQKFSLYDSLSVLQNLRFFSGIYGLSSGRQKAACDEMIEVFHLAPYLDTTPATLPLGFKQRLALACAVMHEPDVLFLDEPTSGVDPVTRREFWTHINGLVAKGVTVMVTTHFMDEAEYCDRIGLVYRGSLIAAGSPDELKQMAHETPNPTMEDAFIELVLRNNSE
jgi:ABC-2 type transport system ATP-binding protein